MQYGVHPFNDEGCTTCAFYRHEQSRCKQGLPSNAGPNEGAYIPPGLSPCDAFVKGFVFVPNSWGRFEPVGELLPPTMEETDVH